MSTKDQQRLKPPTPHVQYLPTILRQVQAGELRVPAFQRGYVWDEKQIRELLQSVYQGYPIGSLLFWKTKDTQLAVESGERFPFPAPPAETSTAFVLDGMQRLATLYNCFFPVNPAKFPKFNVAFDLRTQEFAQVGRAPLQASEIRLNSLFSPKDFLSRQQDLAREPDGDTLLDRAIALHARFQEYMIPTVTIEGRTVPEVVEIFQRINYTGTKLSAVDFMRAVTWSPEFDLTVEVERLRQRLSSRGFDVPPETLVKLVAITKERDPSLDEMLKLRGTDASELKIAVTRAEEALGGAIDFLRSDFRIFSYDYVPYEAQLLVLSKLFLVTNGNPTPGAKAAIRKWFWATSFNEGLQGKADSVIASLLKNVKTLADGDAKPFEVRIEIEPGDILRRRFIARRAVASALATLFASNGARSIVTGEEIATEAFMTEFSSATYWPIFSAKALGDAADYDFDSARLLGNMIVVSPEDRAALRRLGDGAVQKALAELNKEKRVKTLASQVISPRSYRLLAAGNPVGFLESRVEDIVEAAKRVLA